MNYIQQLKLERSRVHMDRMAKAVGNDAAEFKKIVNIVYNAEPSLQKRASWLLEVITRDKPELAKPYTKLFVDSINKFESDSIKRGLLVALGKQKIPQKLQSKALDICFELMLSPDRTVAVKVFAMEVAKNIVLEHRELAGELKAIIEDQRDKNTVAFNARVKMVMKALK